MTDAIREQIECLKAISGDRYRQWETYMSKYNCQTICEIGVRQGFNFSFMTEHKPQLAVAVDSWIEDGKVGHNDACYSQKRLDKQYEKFKAWASDKPFVQIVRKYSFDAVKDFPNEFFDFIFIDADHTFEGVSRDVADWYPKVKKGGVFCGHDYVERSKKVQTGEVVKFGVVRAVDEFVAKNNIDTFFVMTPNSSWGIIKP